MVLSRQGVLASSLLVDPLAHSPDELKLQALAAELVEQEAFAIAVRAGSPLAHWMLLLLCWMNKDATHVPSRHYPAWAPLVLVH